jgi:cyclopropane-fatty-acyl-phospholipid synthase
MYGDITVSSLFAFFKLFILNKPFLSFGSPPGSSFPASKLQKSSISHISRALSNPLSYYLVKLPQAYLNSSTFVGSLSNTRGNISAHYDISNEMFARFLSEDMTYSCGIWTEKDIAAYEEVYGVESLGRTTRRIEDNETQQSKFLDSSSAEGSTLGDSDASSSASHGILSKGIFGADRLRGPLFDAQLRKLRLIIDKAEIKRGHRVLEIGTGMFSIIVNRYLVDNQMFGSKGGAHSRSSLSGSQVA